MEATGTPGTKSKRTMMQLLIIDSSGICYQSAYKLGGLSYDERSTGVIFGFLKTVLQLADKFNTNRFAFCWDSKHSKRREMYPQYKAKRKANQTLEQLRMKEELMPQMRELNNYILPALGFKNSYLQRGYEADDLISALVIDLHGLSGYQVKPVVISRDNDLLQLLEFCDIYDPQTKKTTTAKDFSDKWGFEPELWAWVKAAAGCSGDNVEGLPGVGEITAAKFLQGTLIKGKKYEAVINGKEVITRNLPLVKLPMDGTEIPLLQKEHFEMMPFVELCEDYGFHSFLNGKQLNAWKRVFCGRRE